MSRPPIGFDNLAFVESFRVSAVVDEKSSINFRKGGSEGGWSQSPIVFFLASFFFLKDFHPWKSEWKKMEDRHINPVVAISSSRQGNWANLPTRIRIPAISRKMK